MARLCTLAAGTKQATVRLEKEEGGGKSGVQQIRFVPLGAGYWARLRPAAWMEVGGVECVGIYNRTRSKAEGLARGFGVTACDDAPARLLDTVKPLFVDIVTDVSPMPQ